MSQIYYYAICLIGQPTTNINSFQSKNQHSNKTVELTAENKPIEKGHENWSRSSMTKTQVKSTEAVGKVH